MRDNGDILSYTGRAQMGNLVITNLDFTRDSKNELGPHFTANLQRVQITSAIYVETGATPLMSQQGGAAKKPGNKGEQSTQTSNVNTGEGKKYESMPTPSSGPLNNNGYSQNGLTV